MASPCRPVVPRQVGNGEEGGPTYRRRGSLSSGGSVGSASRSTVRAWPRHPSSCARSGAPHTGGMAQPKPVDGLVRRPALERDPDRAVGHGVWEGADPGDRLGTKRREVAIGEARALSDAQGAPPGAPVAAVEQGPQRFAVRAAVGRRPRRSRRAARSASRCRLCASRPRH